MDSEELGEEVEGYSVSVRELSPRDRLQFAKWVLRGIFLFALVSVGVWLYEESYGETLLDICKTGLLPIASFVVGDYFGSRS